MGPRLHCYCFLMLILILFQLCLMTLVSQFCSSNSVVWMGLAVSAWLDRAFLCAMAKPSQTTFDSLALNHVANSQAHRVFISVFLSISITIHFHLTTVPFCNLTAWQCRTTHFGNTNSLPKRWHSGLYWNSFNVLWCTAVFIIASVFCWLAIFPVHRKFTISATVVAFIIFWLAIFLPLLRLL